VEVEVVDTQGNRCPTALNMVSYNLKGPAEWRGGMAMGPDNYILSKAFPVENGVNRFLVRSSTEPGTITITAESQGLKTATLSLTTKRFAVTNGLASTMPSSGLPVHLERGATPATASYHMTRTPVGVASSTAGAHADSSFASYDDNELSDWVNDGKLSTAWIEYRLEREATISEIVVKLNNFRSRVYPFLVTVDGKKAFNGTTQTTLGYYTIQCKPQTGRVVRIQLRDATAGNGQNMGTEVNGKKLDDGVARNDATSKGTLSIIEVEIYEALKKK
jgi:beta-galactosidase